MSSSLSAASDPPCVIITLFTIPADRSAEELLHLLREVTTTVMQHQPGFRSATLHVSTDGTRVANYAIWDSEDAFRRVLRLPETQAHLAHTQTFPREARFSSLVETFAALP
jgi:quinol monooxygenase YgiN